MTTFIMNQHVISIDQIFYSIGGRISLIIHHNRIQSQSQRLESLCLTKSLS